MYSSRNYPYLHHGGQKKFWGEGVQKEAISKGGGVAYQGLFFWGLQDWWVIRNYQLSLCWASYNVPVISLSKEDLLFSLMIFF